MQAVKILNMLRNKAKNLNNLLDCNETRLSQTLWPAAKSLTLSERRLLSWNMYAAYNFSKVERALGAKADFLASHIAGGGIVWPCCRRCRDQLAVHRACTQSSWRQL